MTVSSPPRRRARKMAPAELNAALATVEAPTALVPRAGGVADGRPIVVVLGMHRSGTSLLAQALHYLGVDMADESDRPSGKNPGGFWERPDLTALHDEVLAAIGRPVESPLHGLPFPPGWWRDKPVQAIKTRMRAYLEGQLARTSGWWGFKDPRSCRLLPLWWELFEELGLKAHYVWAVRTPGEASASMAMKNPAARPMSPAQAEVTWLAYNYDALRYSAGTDPLVVEYGEWFRQPIAVARRLLDRLNLPGFATEGELAECVRRIVNEDYRHEVEGRGIAASRIDLAQYFFSDIVRLGSAGGAAHERMGRYVAMLDVVFRVLVPYAELLDDLPELRRQLRGAEEVLGRLAAVSEERDAVRRLAEERARDLAHWTTRAGELKGSLAAAREERKQTLELLAGLQRELAAARQERDAAKAAGAAEIETLRVQRQQSITERTASAVSRNALAAERDALLDALQQAQKRLAELEAAPAAEGDPPPPSGPADPGP